MEMDRIYGGDGVARAGGEVVMTRDTKPRRWTADLHDRFVDAVTKLGGHDRSSHGQHNMHMASSSNKLPALKSEQGEIPIAEALRCQIEVQKTLQEQLEVQKKLQMRIEAQGKYLQTILEKAQRSLSVNNPGSVDTTKDQLADFNLDLSNFMRRNGKIAKVPELNYMEKVDEIEDVKLKLEGPSTDFDLNTRSSYDFFGPSGSVFEAKPLENR